MRFLTRGGGVALPQILTPLATVLMDVAAVTAHVTPIVAKATPVVTNLMTISCGIIGLLRTRRGWHADGKRQQHGDDCAVSHDLYLEKLESWLRREVDERVNRYSEWDRGNVTNVARTRQNPRSTPIAIPRRESTGRERITLASSRSVRPLAALYRMPATPVTVWSD